MLPQENEEGNIEYKRHFCSDELKILNNDNNVRCAICNFDNIMFNRYLITIDLKYIYKCNSLYYNGIYIYSRTRTREILCRKNK